MLTPTISSSILDGNIDRSTASVMGIDDSGMAHVMGVLTNLYQDKNLAVLREYSTNAADSHVAAGTDRPIEVNLPSDLNPTLVIRDHGVGLSERELTEVYARYGTSTKRDTNTQVGAFGLGCKSAFTLGEQFVVTAVKDGRKTVALFAVNDTGVGTMNVVARGDTDETNGVLVSIGIGDVARMNAKAAEFFSVWQPGSVLVDDSAPDSVYADGIPLADDLYIKRNEGLGEARVVMGNVSYPVSSAVMRTAAAGNGDASEDLFWRLTQGQSTLFITAPIGSVDITPSREGLRDTDKTVSFIAAALLRSGTKITEYIQSALSSAPSFTHAALALTDTKSVLHAAGIRLAGADLNWRGKFVL